MRDWIEYNKRYDREERDDVYNKADSLTKTGKGIVGYASGGGAETTITGNNLTDIHITINLNLGENINPKSLKAVTDIINKLQEIKAPQVQPPVTIIREDIGCE
ncbi:MAG: hypothetical protein K0S93_77 [Nitrososphaeraceae archaeon]|jgi:hypothetical protein|nr:hypothetical protein [Nitrososphaeraceae archaeon]